MRAFLLRRLLHAVFVTWGVVTRRLLPRPPHRGPDALPRRPEREQEEIAHRAPCSASTVRSPCSTSTSWARLSAATSGCPSGRSAGMRMVPRPLLARDGWSWRPRAALSTVARGAPRGDLRHASRSRRRSREPIASLFCNRCRASGSGSSDSAVRRHARGLLPAYGTGTWRHSCCRPSPLAAAPLAQKRAPHPRPELLEVLSQDYVWRAKGWPSPRVYRHALRNARCRHHVRGLSLGSC